MRAALIATALLFSALVQAQSTEVETYTYGTRLDVASVVSVKIKPTPNCEVTDAVMSLSGLHRKRAQIDLSHDVRLLQEPELSQSSRQQTTPIKAVLIGASTDGGRNARTCQP